MNKKLEADQIIDQSAINPSILYISSVESQKGANNIQRCSDQNQKSRRALSLYKVYSDSALLVLNGTSLNSDSALLAINDDMSFAIFLKIIIHKITIIMMMMMIITTIMIIIIATLRSRRRIQRRRKKKKKCEEKEE